MTIRVEGDPVWASSSSATIQVSILMETEVGRSRVAGRVRWCGLALAAFSIQRHPVIGPSASFALISTRVFFADLGGPA